MGKKDDTPGDQTNGGRPGKCSLCHGAKRIQVTEEHNDSETVTEHFVTCPQCGGTGEG